MEKIVDKKKPQLDAFSKIAQKKEMAAVCSFMDGSLFPIVLAAFVFLFYVLNVPLLSLLLCVVCLCFVFLFLEDTRPAIAILFLMTLSFRYKDNAEAYLSFSAIAAYAFLLPVVIFSIVYRLVLRRVEWKEKSGLLSMALLSVAFLTCGIFSKYYDLLNFGYGVAAAAVLFGCYAVFAFTMRSRADNLLYLARVCAVSACMIALEVLELYIRKYEWGTPLDTAWKNEVVLGWSISNLVAEVMVFFLPAIFYLIYKEKYGYLYWIAVAVVLIAVYFTFGRNALLWGGITTLIGTAINLFAGRNKRIHRRIILTIAVLGIGILLLLYFTGHLSTLMRFFQDVKLDDRGRFKIWEVHLDFFGESPVFGVGFQAYCKMPGVRVRYAHNHLIQMLASTGVVGFVLYGVHRVQTVCLLLKKRTMERLFMSGCLAVGMAMSLLSPLFFLVYFLLYYSIILLFLEKSVD